MKVFTQLETVIQGEGANMGTPMILVRFRGCNLNCSFCDTDVNAEPKYSLEDFKRLVIANNQISWVMVTGGEPGINLKLLSEVSFFARSNSMRVAVETNGLINIPSDFVDSYSVSPKLKNAGYSIIPYLRPKFKGYIQNNRKKMNLKFVYTGKDSTQDIEEVVRYIEKIPLNRIWIMPEGDTREKINVLKEEAIEYCMRKGYNFTDRIHII